MLKTKTKKPMHVVLKSILIYIGSGILGLIASIPFGKLYRFIEGPYHTDNIGVIFSESADTFLGGFIWGYLFFIGLLVALFVKRKFWSVWIIGFILLGWAALGEWRYFLLALAFTIIGFLLGKLILWIKNKIK